MKRAGSLTLWLLFLGTWLMLANCGGGGTDPDAETGSKPTAPGPFNLIAPVNGDAASVQPTLSWSPAAKATSYRVELMSYPSAAILHTAAVASPTTIYSSPTLTVGQSYYWTVWAVNSVGESASQRYYFTVNDSGGLVWTKTSPGTTYDAEPFTMAIDTTHMYVAGYQLDASGEDRWRIEKRSLADGGLDSSFGTSGIVNSESGTAAAPVAGTVEDVWAIAVGTDALYLVGYDSIDLSGNERWRIEKRDLVYGNLVTAFDGDGVISEDIGTSGSKQALAVALDSTALYVAGFDASGPDGAEGWRIEKRDLISGATSTQFLISAASSTSAAQAIAVTSGTTGTVYAGGYSTSGGVSYWRLEARDKTSGAINTFASDMGMIKGEITALLINGNDLYVVGSESNFADSWWRIERRDLSNGLITASTFTANPTTGSDIPYAVTTDGTNIYVAGHEGTTDSSWRIQKFSLALVPDTTFGTNGVVRTNPGPYHDVVYGIAANASGLYVAGPTAPDYAYQWRMEKRKK